jgi:pyruvate kinase
MVRRAGVEKTITNAISHATCTTAHDLQAAAIVTVTETGETARSISKFRPSSPIIGCTTDKRTLRQLNLSWGVTPVLIKKTTNTDDLFAAAAKCALGTKIVKGTDIIVLTAGVPIGISGTTNILKVVTAGEAMAHSG